MAEWQFSVHPKTGTDQEHVEVSVGGDWYETSRFNFRSELLRGLLCIGGRLVRSCPYGVHTLHRMTSCSVVMRVMLAQGPKCTDKPLRAAIRAALPHIDSTPDDPKTHGPGGPWVHLTLKTSRG